MEITTFEVINIDGTIIEWVQIDRGNGEYTSMSKTYFDELQANQNNGGLN
jgi:hypothetical protein